MKIIWHNSNIADNANHTIDLPDNSVGTVRFITTNGAVYVFHYTSKHITVSGQKSMLDSYHFFTNSHTFGDFIEAARVETIVPPGLKNLLKKAIPAIRSGMFKLNFADTKARIKALLEQIEVYIT